MLTVIVKKPGEDPSVEQIGNNPAAMRQAVLDTVTKQTPIANDGRNRFVFISRRDNEGDLNFVIEGAAFFGPAIFTKLDPSGKRFDLTEQECEEWLDYIGKLAQHAVEDSPEPVERQRDERIINDHHSIQIVPSCSTDEDSGALLTPEQIVERMAEQVGIEFEHVPLTDQNVYGAALVVLESQGVNYSVIDEASMLLDFPDEGDSKCERERYLRIIEITKIEESEEARQHFPHLGS